jgi:hypothetical protein
MLCSDIMGLSGWKQGRLKQLWQEGTATQEAFA